MTGWPAIPEHLLGRAGDEVDEDRPAVDSPTYWRTKLLETQAGERPSMAECGYPFPPRPVCDYAGHEWAPAGGGLLICTDCLAEKWDEG